MSAPSALLFDVGNTRLKWGLYEKGRLSKTGSISHEKLHDAGFTPLTTRLPRDVDRVLASNVAGPSFATRLSAVVGIHCGQDVHFAHAEKSAYGLTNRYARPRRIGVDRWVAMIGARAEYKGALCVVDAGTAVTIDAIDKAGQHLGGLILPGVELMARALHLNTGEIPQTRPGKTKNGEPLELFSGTTAGAVQNGAVAAIVGAVDRAMRALRKASMRPRVIVTGGDAKRILAELGEKAVHRPNLVLQGLAFMVDAE